MPFEFICDECRKPFTRQSRRTGAAGGTYCSRDCYWKAMVKPIPNRLCAGCGQEFDPRMGGRKSSLYRDYCTRTCYDYTRAHTLERWLELQSGDGCWPWPNGCNKDGYGVTWRGDAGQQLVHREVWKLLVGEIPDDMTLDHMCHNRDTSCPGGRTCLHRPCANPAHLVVADGVENTLRGKNPWAVNKRKVKCKHGHLFTVANTYIRADGTRGCRACRQVASQRYRQNRRAA